MSVYILVVFHDYLTGIEELEIVGVFSSYEKAREAFSNLAYRPTYTGHSIDRYEVE